MPKPHVTRKSEVGKTSAQVDEMRREKTPRTWHTQQQQFKRKRIVSIEYEPHTALRNQLCHSCSRVILKGEKYSRATTATQQKVSICLKCQGAGP
ncbi:MAG: hypothetical protein PHD25_12545 [Bacteroidales bacterium]|nr:hypothetical protein [Bacteroidales bacterium]